MNSDITIHRPMVTEQTAPVQTPQSQTRSSATAHERVNNFMGHSYALLAHLEEQNSGHTGEVAVQVNNIYLQAASDLFKIEAQIKHSIQESPNLSKKEVKELAKALKTAEKDIAKVLQKAQIDVASEIGSAGRAELKGKIATLAQGGFKAKFIGLLALVSSTNKAAVDGFKQAKLSMETASKKAFAEPVNNESEVQRDQRTEFNNFREGVGNLKRRAGIIGLNGVYRVQVTFSDKAIQKQFKSFIAQNQSQKTERVTIARDLTTQNAKGEQVQFKSKLVPLNKEFDSLVNVKGEDGAASRVFENIFGEKGGISSANRQESHLINGWESNLSDESGTRIYQALRHGITSDKFETDKDVRQANSKKAAGELLKAALMQQLGDQGLSLEDASRSTSPITLNFNSVSLVTPDDFRAIGTKGANEKNMLFDQTDALHSYAGTNKTLVVDGFPIPINLSVNTFNFGVNVGAVGYGLGTINQYEQNVKALQGLEAQAQAAIDKLPQGTQKDNLKELLGDIKSLMADRKAYLDGDNQYEVGAKIINLSNQLDQLNGNTKCAFNCMSGKDRTGMMDGVAKAFAVMRSINGKIPTHEDLKNNEEIREQFRSILVPILLEMGGIDITEINTSATGYKVGKEAQLAQLPDDKFLEMLGLAKTTSS